MRYLVVALVVGCLVGQAAASIDVVRSDRSAHGHVSLAGGTVSDTDDSLALNPADWSDLSALATNSDSQSSGEASSFLHSSFAGSTFSFDGNVAFSQSGPTGSGGLAFTRASFLFFVDSPVSFSANLLDMGTGGVLRLSVENGPELLEVFTGYNGSFALGEGFYRVDSFARAFNGISQDFDYSFSFDSDVTFGAARGLPELSSIATWSVVALGGCLAGCRSWWRRT